MGTSSFFMSFYFICFFAALLLIYYCIPKKTQWMFLLLCSAAYYLLSGNGILILYPIAGAAVSYAGARIISVNPDRRVRKTALLLTIAAQLGVLILLKYVNFGVNTVNGLSRLFGADGDVLNGLGLLAPLGLSFYTFSLIGYVTDVYNGIAEAQTNLCRTALFGMYFPAVISGPILSYREHGDQFFKPHPFDYREVTSGLQRMLWGFFKKLVISERMALVVNSVYGEYGDYPGSYIWLATVCFAFQLYTDFSGCMDIVLGLSQTLGIRLPENFERPFFSKTISEYWRRWHITLGVWMKEYVFYPLLRSRFFTEWGKRLKKRLGKKRGKQMTTFAAMFLLWFGVGIWHGGDWKYVIGSGLLHWFYIVCGELLTPFYSRVMAACHIHPKSRWLDGLRILRTFFLVNIGFVFFRADSVGDALRMLGSAVSVWNLPSLLRGGVLTLGLNGIEWTVAAVSLLLLLAVSAAQRKGSLRERIAGWKLPVRWLVWYALLFYVILLGYYGPGYSAAEFIYQGF